MLKLRKLFTIGLQARQMAPFSNIADSHKDYMKTMITNKEWDTLGVYETASVKEVYLAYVKHGNHAFLRVFMKILKPNSTIPKSAKAEA